ncbi:Jacalin domain-containing protein [Rhizoctonia solani AG-1 IA]|uniref:Jacalin domain-containing protein n=1 Tax=Thanatephorus cucumeris (strain AG1-IA) TaxID=983506 RepID=L8WGX6_THACA|nr:Jacalin domain-containing protein [Rhizoctonia solani AG-1 IA]
MTRRTLARRLRVQVMVEDLSPVPEFARAIIEALEKPSLYERFQAVYQVLSRWGDVIPLEMEMGFSLSLTDQEAYFNQGLNNAGWNDGTWTSIDFPAIEWRPIKILAVAPTFSLFTDDIKTRLADLHNAQLSYCPLLTVDPINWHCTIHHDTINASKTVSKVGIRCGNHIIALSITYLDGTTLRAGGNGNVEHLFTLTNGEYIVEMLTSTHVGWLHGIQFITNKGRCSAIYGWLEGIPNISRSEGGALAGLLVSTKEHNQHGRLVTGVNVSIVVCGATPKENDVYSEYFGGTVQHGKGFNDRSILGDSNSIYISSVEVRGLEDIHSIEFTYTDPRNGKDCKVKTPRHGGSHGPCYRFDLEHGEHIVSIGGKYNDHYIRQLYFGTNLGGPNERRVWHRGRSTILRTRPLRRGWKKPSIAIHNW